MFYHKYWKRIFVLTSIIIFLFLAGFSYGHFIRVTDKQMSDDSANSLESDQGLEEMDESMETALKVSKTEGKIVSALQKWCHSHLQWEYYCNERES